MAHRVTSPSPVVAVLEHEVATIDRVLVHLTDYRLVLQQTLELHRATWNLTGPVPTPECPQPVELVSPLTDGQIPKHAAPSTVEMTRTVLRNAGRPLTRDAIRLAIKQTYGLDLAHGLDQMLYKRVQARKGFYRTAAGEFGLSDPPTGAV